MCQEKGDGTQTTTANLDVGTRKKIGIDSTVDITADEKFLFILQVKDDILNYSGNF